MDQIKSHLASSTADFCCGCGSLVIFQMATWKKLLKFSLFPITPLKKHFSQGLFDEKSPPLNERIKIC